MNTNTPNDELRDKIFNEYKIQQAFQNSINELVILAASLDERKLKTTSASVKEVIGDLTVSLYVLKNHLTNEDE